MKRLMVILIFTLSLGGYAQFMMTSPTFKGHIHQINYLNSIAILSSLDLIRFELIASGKMVSGAGRTNFVSLEVTNHGTIGITLDAPVIYNNLGFPGLSVYLDNGTIGQFDPLFDAPLTNSLFIAAGTSRAILYGIGIPVGTTIDTITTNTLQFLLDTSLLTNGPLSSSLPERSSKITQFNRVVDSVSVRKITDGIDTLLSFNGTGSLRNMPATVSLSVAIPVNGPKGVVILYSSTGVPSAWDGNLPGVSSVTCSGANGAWSGVLPLEKLDSAADIVFAIKINGIMSFASSGAVPWKFSVKTINLAQGRCVILNNRINPLKGEMTSIVLTLSKASRCRISIIDVSGAQVALLTDAVLAEGQHVIKWDGHGTGAKPVVNGIYIAIVDTEMFHEIKKVLVVKK